MEVSQTSFMHTPGHFSHAIRPSLDIATPLFYSNTTSDAKPVEGLGIPPTTRKASACSGKRRWLALCARQSPVSGCPQPASPGGDGDPPPNLPYFIPSLLNRHLEKVGQTCEKLTVRAWGDFYTGRILFADMLRERTFRIVTEWRSDGQHLV